VSARGWFVTGTDTGVGKTLVACALLHRLRADGRRVAALKPVAAGCTRTPHGLRNDDAERLRAAAGRDDAYARVNPYAFAPPIAPHLAAAEVGVAIDLDVIGQAYRELASDVDDVVVEGAGGWLVPLDDRHTLADVACRLGLDVVLVVGVRLGCLNHALLTAASVRDHGLRLAGWVASVIDPRVERLEGQLQTLGARLAAPCWGVVPPLADPSPAAVAAHLAAEALA
jgi:dethiobiotin synthetase